MKKDYVAPELTALGSFETLTKAMGTGGVTDSPFPRSTPEPDLTFSNP